MDENPTCAVAMDPACVCLHGMSDVYDRLLRDHHDADRTFELDIDHAPRRDPFLGHGHGHGPGPDGRLSRVVYRRIGLEAIFVARGREPVRCHDTVYCRKDRRDLGTVSGHDEETTPYVKVVQLDCCTLKKRRMEYRKAYGRPDPHAVLDQTSSVAALVLESSRRCLETLL